MSDFNIEQAGVHYASHTLMETQRELQRELAKESAHGHPYVSTTRGVNSAKASTVASRPSLVAANQDPPPADAQVSSADETCTVFPYVRTGKASDLLEHLGKQPPGDYTLRQMQEGPIVPQEMLRSTTNEPTAQTPEIAVESCPAVAEKSEEEALNDEDAEAAAEFVKNNPRRRREFLAILQQLREQRYEREDLQTHEEFVRHSIADLWNLQWEDLYEVFLEARKRAAEDMRARLSKVHWREHLATRQKQLELKREERKRESIFHKEPILAELDMKRYLEWWNTQLASFEINTLMITGPDGKQQLSIEDCPSNEQEPTA